MDILKLIEELHSMLESKTIAVCSIEYMELNHNAPEAEYNRLPWQKSYNIKSAVLEDAIPLLFQADIDQWIATEVRTEAYMIQDRPNYFIHIKLTRCI